MVSKRRLAAPPIVMIVSCSFDPIIPRDATPDAGIEDRALHDADRDPLDGDSVNAPSDARLSGDADSTDLGSDASSVDADTRDAGRDAGVDAGASTFVVLTINLKHPLTGLAEASDRLAMVADGIVATQPDVVALQEVIRDDGQPSYAELLAQMTGYEWIWELTYRVPLFFDEGLGVLSRWPIVWSESARLPHLDLVAFSRRVLGARVRAPGGEFQLFCVHMTTDSNETIKADQAAAVLDFIAAHPSPRPGFLAGDLNAEPDSLAMRLLRGEAQHDGRRGALVDAWLATNPADDGFTMHSDNPTRRIDYIYAIPGSGGATARPRACERMFTQPDGDLYASDHLGVLCELEL
ncbi:MAG: endonuclease/exonuclease/phosphatase family protein [Deltaproteobacteria bacterium]|nr:endonuclease/exonuclease/phosphatase family protein [Deltaproteobacteria bacterium]